MTPIDGVGMASDSETWTEQVSRLNLMVSDLGHWDLSPNDRAAIKAALSVVAELHAALAAACAWIPESHWIGETRGHVAIARIDALLARTESTP